MRTKNGREHNKGIFLEIREEGEGRKETALLLTPELFGELKVARNSSQHLYSDGSLNHSLSLDATTMVSKNCPTIGEHVVTIFVTQ